MLWNTVYEFFVKYVFGGVLHSQQYFALFGSLYDNQSGEPYYDLSMSDVLVGQFEVVDASYKMPMFLGNYLALIATIITMVAIVLLCCAFIKKIYNMCAHIIG